MRALVFTLALLSCPLHAADLQQDLLMPVQGSVPEDTLLSRAETLDAEAIEAILEAAYASVGCALPTDLVSVFEVFLVDRAMMALGEPVGADVAQQGFVASRLNSGTIRHPEALAILAAARAVDGQVAAEMRAGRITMQSGLFHVADCEPTGTVFALSPYAQH